MQRGQPIDPRPARVPGRVMLSGRYVRLEPLDPARHAEALWKGTSGRENEPLWEYLKTGPFDDRAAFDRDLSYKASTTDPLFFTIVDLATNAATGIASYMRIDPENRVIEVGGILYTPALQRTRGATEAMYLMAKHAFEDLGYRRYEWKCNALNDASRRAALRLGFTYEGLFRQHMIVKGRNRDTAWYSMLDSEWPVRRDAFERWLAPDNFNSAGRQKSPLVTAVHREP